jgi:hypothetical protein
MEDKFNKLDNFLRRHLHDTSENQNWNVPDDAIFEKAMRTVAEGKKKKRGGLILLPFFLAAALLVSEYIVHNREVKMLQGKITTLEDNLSRESADDDLAPSTKSSSATGSMVSTTSDVDHGQTKTNPSTARRNNQNKPGQGKTTAETLATANAIPPSSSSALNSNVDEASSSSVDHSVSPMESKPGESAHENITNTSLTNTWVTNPIRALEAGGVEKETTPVLIILPDPVVSQQTESSPVYAMQFGLLLGANQSWLTMKNIPPTGNAYLHEYDNSQPGFSMNAFVNKPFSPKFSWQAGLGYNVYNSKSILEDQFLLDLDNVTPMPDGQYIYQTDYNLVNPIGEYSMMLDFRMSGNMQENDTIVEYTTIEQTFQSVMLDLGIHYDLVTLGDFKVTLGTGLGLGYRSGLKNVFNVFTYYNDILQKKEMETSDYMYNVNRWHLQLLGNVNLAYYPTKRLGIILSTQYNGGLTSIRGGGSDNGPLTFIHAFSLSAGISHGF